MKRILSVFLCLACLVTIAGCATDSTSSKKEQAEQIMQSEGEDYRIASKQLVAGLNDLLGLCEDAVTSELNNSNLCINGQLSSDEYVELSDGYMEILDGAYHYFDNAVNDSTFETTEAYYAAFTAYVANLIEIVDASNKLTLTYEDTGALEKNIGEVEPLRVEYSVAAIAMLEVAGYTTDEATAIIEFKE